MSTKLIRCVRSCTVTLKKKDNLPKGYENLLPENFTTICKMGSSCAYASILALELTRHLDLLTYAYRSTRTQRQTDLAVHCTFLQHVF